MRPIWSGLISFGLVNIPVKLYSGSEDRGISFNFLHKEDLSPIRYAKVCSREDKEVEYHDIVRGYELEEDEYVPVTEDDFKKANVKKSKTIEILGFVKLEEISPEFFEKPYFLEPTKDAEKPYALLRETLAKSKKVGIAKFVLRNKEKLGIIRPQGNLIQLEQMRFAEDLRSGEDLKVPGRIELQEQELSLAQTLIDKLTVKFKPNEYRDEYTNQLKEIIEEKAKGIKPVARGKSPKATEVGDLMKVLQESLKQEKVKK